MVAVQARTKVAANTLTPRWEEELHVLVQEPTTQQLRVEMFDHDMINVKASFKPGFLVNAGCIPCREH